MTVAFNKLNEGSLEECIYSLATAIRQDFCVENVKQQMDLLVTEAKSCMSPEMSQEMKLVRLTELFYHQWHFRGSSGVYSMSDALWPDKVLETRQGMPAALGIIFMHLASQIGIRLDPVIFPSQLLLRADWFTDGNWGINPQNGERLSMVELRSWLKGSYGIAAELSDELLAKADNEQIIYKLLGSLKNAFMQTNHPEDALKANKLMIDLNPDDPYEIRDRGLIYAQLDCEHVALSDLYYFIEKCPEDPVVEVVKMQIHAIGKSQITLH